jgi:phage terminase large subunit-like protein
MKGLNDWDEFKRTYSKFSPIASDETFEQQKERIATAKAQYVFFVEYYFPHYADFECADFHIEAANMIAEDDEIWILLEWARGLAKSTHADILIPLWLMIKGKLHFMLLVGQSLETAIDLLGDLRTELIENERFIHDFGKQLEPTCSERIFITYSGVVFKALGAGQSPRGTRINGYRPDYVAIDDLETDKLARNPDMVEQLYDWLTGALMGVFGKKATGFIRRMVVANNYFTTEGIIGMLLNNPEVKIQKVNALLPPEKPLDNPTWKYDGFTPAWLAKDTLADYKKLYVRNPINFDGEYMQDPKSRRTLFRTDWIRWLEMNLAEYPFVIAYIDPAFKKNKKSDFCAIRCWAEIVKNERTEYHLLDGFVRRSTVPEAVEWLYLFAQKRGNLPTLYYIEDAFFQDKETERTIYTAQDFKDEIIAQYNDFHIRIELKSDRRRKLDKITRIKKTQKYYANRQIVYNSNIRNTPDMQVGISQLIRFPKWHDDALDADDGAIHWLQNTCGDTPIEIITESRGRGDSHF